MSRLMLFFAIVYTVEGFCQAKVGVIWQPLTHYLKESQGWDPVQIAASLAVLALLAALSSREARAADTTPAPATTASPAPLDSAPLSAATPAIRRGLNGRSGRRNSAGLVSVMGRH